jgi:hypothetical protein
VDISRKVLDGVEKTFLDIVRLGYVIVSSHLEQGYNQSNILLLGDKDDTDIFIFLPDPLQHFEARQIGEPVIESDDIGGFAEVSEEIPGIEEALHFIIGIQRQGIDKQLVIPFIVFNHKYPDGFFGHRCQFLELVQTLQAAIAS